ncbi:transcriptional regulator GcvA [Geminicoccus roseus]|uniref:transcriptional regulator GcvA n=1 Tax=Geminicoccus roseus TaxID=404900 RepID=UPI000486362A|nr:transcriptional regulator GcvA [Geminicoccus roseus]
MPYRLPPLNGLRLFEAAGRHLSFKLAAEELCLTPSAVSHGIHSLEEWLGVSLFVRGHRGLVMTVAGAAYLPRVREALELLATATEAVPGRRPSGRLSISVAPSFGLRWLIPNLPRFGAQHPHIEVTVDTSHRQIEFPRDGMDLAIRMGRGDWPDLHASCLIVEALVPVCAPAVAGRIATATDLTRQTLLHVTNISEDWAQWARLAGVDGLDLSRGLRFDTIHMAMEAAAQGLGVAIGRLPLIAMDLATGRLVPVLAPARRGRTGYWLTTSREALTRPEVAVFRNWIRAELKETASPVLPQRPA